MAGLPQGVLCVVPGRPEAGEALTLDPNVNMISFTGSTVAGRKVAENAGKTLKKVALELGGKNSTIVFEDADLDAVTSATAFGSFFHQGQICFAIGRHLVHESVARTYGEKLAQRARNLQVGDPYRAQVHLGPIINEKQASRVERLVGSSIAAGARATSGGSRQGLYFQPTVLEGVTPGMAVYSEETFGPVASILSFRTEEEAITLANDTEYGLVASIFTADQARAMRVAAQRAIPFSHYSPIRARAAASSLP